MLGKAVITSSRMSASFEERHLASVYNLIGLVEP